MDIVKKYMPTAIVALLIVVFLVALFYAIYFHIDGLGIFSIVGAIIFFSFVLYEIKKRRGTNSNADNLLANNLSHSLRIVTNPLFIRLLPSLLTVLFSYLERHKDKLDNAAAQELQKDLQLTLDKFKLGLEKLETKLGQDPELKSRINNKPDMI